MAQVTDLGSRALAISLPFSCVLGLLSSMIASTMGNYHVPFVLIFFLHFLLSFLLLLVHSRN